MVMPVAQLFKKCVGEPNGGRVKIGRKSNKIEKLRGKTAKREARFQKREPGWEYVMITC